jgi:hypothetical protein
VFGRAARNVRVVVLNLFQRQTVAHGPFPAQLGGQVLRMPINREDVRFVVEQLAVEREAAAVLDKGYDLLEIAQVLRKDRLPILEEAEGILELAAHRQNRRSCSEALRQRNRRRCITARPPQHAGFPADHPGHGVVDAIDDVAVVEQPIIGDPCELQPRLVIADALRLVGEIAARQHDRPMDAFEQQVVERRVGQHKAEHALAGRHCRGHPFAALCRQHDNGRRRAAQ